MDIRKSLQLLNFCIIIICQLSCDTKYQNQTILQKNVLTEQTQDNIQINYNDKYLNLLDIIERMRVYTEEERHPSH